MKFCLLPVIVFLTNSCNYGKNIVDSESQKHATKTIVINEPFSGVVASTGFEIIYTQDSLQSEAVVSGDKYSVEKLTYKINKDGDLIFYFNKSDNKAKPVKITLNGKALKNIQANSRGKLTITTPVKQSQSMNISATSGGNITINEPIETKKNLYLNASSGAKISLHNEITGKNIKIDLSSLGKLSCGDMVTELLSLSMSSNSNCGIDRCSAQSLQISSVSNAKVNIYGCTAVNAKINTSSAGKVYLDDCKSLSINASATSGSSIGIAGATRDASFNAVSGAVVNAENLKVSNSFSKSTSSGGRVIYD